MEPICKTCAAILTDENWTGHRRKTNRRQCNDCYNAYHKEYMAKKKLDDEYRLKYNEYFRDYNGDKRSDPEYRKKYNKKSIAYQNKRYANDPVYREKKKLQNKLRYQSKKEKNDG
ncbi:MAG: hypothetical protein WCH62_04095 [Candidatus Omnitrophota bacterium]